MFNLICEILIAILLIAFVCIIFTYAPHVDYKKQGRAHAYYAYYLTKVIPNEPNLEYLIKAGYSSDFIKFYLIGFREGIKELKEKYIEK